MMKAIRLSISNTIFIGGLFMKKGLLLISVLLMTMLLWVGCGTKETNIANPPDAAKKLADNLGIPCISTKELNDNVAYYTGGCIVYGTVTKISFDDFSADSVHYKDYMAEMRKSLEEDSSTMIDELMSAMEAKIKNTYEYML